MPKGKNINCVANDVVKIYVNLEKNRGENEKKTAF